MFSELLNKLIITHKNQKRMEFQLFSIFFQSFSMKSSKVSDLLKALQSRENEEIVSRLEKEVAEEIETSVASDLFFTIPLGNLFSIVSKIDFYDVENY